MARANEVKVLKGPDVCTRCGGEWYVKEHQTSKTTIVTNYWCTRCDEIKE